MYRLRVLEEGVVDLIHGDEVLHGGEVDVYFDDCGRSISICIRLGEEVGVLRAVLQTAASSLEDGG